MFAKLEKPIPIQMKTFTKVLGNSLKKYNIKDSELQMFQEDWEDVDWWGDLTGFRYDMKNMIRLLSKHKELEFLKKHAEKILNASGY